ncbi:T9SS type A sorting domain-containing protein [Mangrovibacterium diazotrophicum]|uniref:Putative secreted protein (Por secretion system target) n=1 Tax=Mangrovibacterium diazotrophicum TaxID=1261403 RepID=A0A419W7T7_9BACT|nr:T9SS type A sorting domain-containing protein [Mangrovibacterium diazotrophicum]RKD91505.1 putative secreted protein (Por secretion system target) [Mangrovibacterium diazotrophicum]
MRIANWTRRLNALVIIGVLLTGNVAWGQIEDGGLPASFATNLKAAAIISQKSLNPIDLQEQISLDEKDGVQNRYGVVEDVALDIRKAGSYSQTGNMNIWRLQLSADEALSLAVILSTFDIPEGASLYVYTPDQQTVRGAYTWQNKKESGLFRVGDLMGDQLIVEYDEPVSASFEGGVVIGAVVKAYRSLEANANERIQINCPEGEDWQEQKKAVCMITFSDGTYSYYCSGALLNNAREDGTPYFLTANHCISSTTEASTLVAYFNYENSTCESSDASLSQSVSGASLRASNQYSDFTLLELQEYPPKEYNPFFAGWDVSGSTSESGTCIHHPKGSTKCIALDYDEVTGNSYTVRWDDGTISQPNSHWEVDYDAGIDEGGSSGAPLFNQDKLLVGQLHGGDDNSSLFGKLSLSWDYRSESDRQLKHWLDPDDTGMEQIEGLEAYTRPVAAFSAEVSILCLSENLILSDESKYSPESWSWEISPSTYVFVNGTSASSQNPEVQFLSEGVYSVSLTVANENGSDELVEGDFVSVYAQLPVRLAGLPDEMTMCGWELDGYEFVAEGAPEYSLELTAESKFVVTQTDNVFSVSLSDEGREEGSFDTYAKITGTQGGCSASDSVLIHVIIPENDNVAQAVALRLGNNGYYSNACATVEDNEPSPETAGCSIANNWCPPNGTDVLDNSIWFYFEGPSSSSITIQTEGIDSQIAVYRATTADYLLSGSTASYNLVGASERDADGNDAAAIENLSVTPGAKYWLQVDGTDAAEGEIGLRLLTNSIEVYPNPSSGLYHLTVASVEGGEAELFVYNQLGQMVYSGTGTFDQDENTIDFDLSNNPAGIYYFRASINGEMMSKKLILVK